MARIPPPATPANSGDSASETEKEREQYSLDEMMRALRDKEREKEEKGEIVTRSDGSVARKVKRRRRRSDQPEKSSSSSPEKEKKSLLFKITIACSLLLLTLLCIGFMLLSYNSKGNRAKIETAAADWTGAKIEFNGAKFFPGSASMKGANFEWGASSFIKDLKLRKVRGDQSLFSFFGARPGGLEIGGRVGTLVTQVPQGDEAVGKAHGEDQFPFDYGRYYCDALDVVFGSSKTIGFKGTSVSLRHIPSEGFRASLDQGMFQLAGWKDFPVNNGLIYFRDGYIEVVNFSLDQPEQERSGLGTTLDITGNIPLTIGEKGQLNLNVENFPAPILFGEKLARFFDGTIRKSNDGKVTLTMGRGSLDEIEVPFDADYLRVSRFQFVSALQEVFPNEGWDQLDFDTEATGTLRVRPEGVALENLSMSQKDILHLKGGIIITREGRLAGSLRLELNWALVERNPRLKKLPGIRRDEDLARAIFEFDLDGTAKDPKDNFRQLIGLGSSPSTLPTIRNGLDLELWKKAINPELNGDE